MSTHVNLSVEEFIALMGTDRCRSMAITCSNGNYSNHSEHKVKVFNQNQFGR